MHLPTLLWALVIAAGLLFPGPEPPRPDPTPSWGPALAHFGLCAVLALLFYRSLAGAGHGPSPVRVFAATFLYAGLLEVAQLWVPGRSWEVMDLVMNGLGAALGALLARRLYSRVNDVSPSMS